MYDTNVRSTTNTAGTTSTASEVAPGRSRKATESPGVSAEGLGKRYGDLWALRELDLQIPAGSVLG
ncbi:MAG TPA: hypothetical protein VLK58_00190, partial [Conexibacter sp.]|nr:hypothetical protein [Conexibacter sp.]